MKHWVVITPNDPIISRDGRPFGVNQGYRMKSLDWIYPSTITGSFRTMIGKEKFDKFDPKVVEQLKLVTCTGPFLSEGDSVFFPQPHDFLIKSDGKKKCIVPLRPAGLKEGEGSNLPGKLLPVFHNLDEDFKPELKHHFLSSKAYFKWLETASGDDTTIEFNDTDFKKYPEHEERFHVSIDSLTHSALESMLYMTSGLVFSEGLKILMSVDSPDSLDDTIVKLNLFHPLGGERRLVHWRTREDCQAVLNCPVSLRQKFKASTKIRMALITPGIFAEGWKPAWLNDNLEGSVPGSSIRLKLMGASIERWKPISGWNLESGCKGPKPIRRLVSAGSVYFFEYVSGNREELADNLWLSSISDDKQDCKDGFGSVIWGVW